MIVQESGSNFFGFSPLHLASFNSPSSKFQEVSDHACKDWTNMHMQATGLGSSFETFGRVGDKLPIKLADVAVVVPIRNCQ